MASARRTTSVVGLTEANRAALAQVAACAERERPRHMARIEGVLAAAGVQIDVAALLDVACRGGSLTLNFHPDRLLADGRSVAEALCDDGVYRSQFETGISNGGLTAYPGGDRDIWERALFAGAYHAPGVAARERPTYGGLNLMNHLNGACPRFGSCHLRLRPAASERATLIFGDSVAGPTDIGLSSAFAPVLAPLLEAIASGAGALGRAGVDVRSFVEGLMRGDHGHGRGVFAPAMAHTLDDYVEAQVHGELRLGVDVEAVVVDPAFRDTRAGELLRRTARRHGFETEWHAGLVLALCDIPAEAPDAPEAEVMRWQRLCAGGRALRLAQRVAEEHGSQPRLDAANIGQAAANVVRAPERWRAWGEPHAVLVHLKDLWLMLVAHAGRCDRTTRGLAVARALPRLNLAVGDPHVVRRAERRARSPCADARLAGGMPGRMEDPATQELAAAALMRECGVDHAEAIRRLEFQDAVDDALDLDEISEILGDRDGAQWFDHDDGGRLKVGIVRRDGSTEGPEVDRARRLLEAHRLSDGVDFVAVDHSYRELQRVQEATVGPQVEDLLRAGKVMHGIDTSQNAIVISVARSATAAERRGLRLIADRAPVRVDLCDIDVPTLLVTVR